MKKFILRDHTDQKVRHSYNSYLLALPTWDIGGAEMQALRFADYLLARGKRVVFSSKAPRGKVIDICKAKDIPCVCIREPSRPLMTLLYIWEKIRFFYSPLYLQRILSYKLARYIKKERFDVCVGYCSNASTWLGHALKYYKTPVSVWFQRDAGIFNYNNVYEKEAIEEFDYILANSEGGKAFMEHHYHRRVEVIHNGVSLASPKKSIEQWRRELQIPTSAILCTMVGNLTKAKDHLSILKIWSLLQDQIKEELPYLVFAGRLDSEYRMLLQYVKRHKLDKKVQFLGLVEDITGLLQATDICVFGAKSEGSPNGIIEATLAGLPVVATDLTEIRHVVSEENVPFLFPKDEPEAALDRIQQLVTDADLRKRMGSANKKRNLVLFNQERNFGKIVELVERGRMSEEG